MQSVWGAEEQPHSPQSTRQPASQMSRAWSNKYQKSLAHCASQSVLRATNLTAGPQASHLQMRPTCPTATPQLDQQQWECCFSSLLTHGPIRQQWVICRHTRLRSDHLQMRPSLPNSNGSAAADKACFCMPRGTHKAQQEEHSNHLQMRPSFPTSDGSAATALTAALMV